MSLFASGASKTSRSFTARFAGTCAGCDEEFEAGTEVMYEEDQIVHADPSAVNPSRTGTKVGCVEEIAWVNGWIDDDQLRSLATDLEKSGYGAYLSGLLAR